jgi:hypothetical protein
LKEAGRRLHEKDCPFDCCPEAQLQSLHFNHTFKVFPEAHGECLFEYLESCRGSALPLVFGNRTMAKDQRP